LAKEARISLKVYDIQGRLMARLADGLYAAGEHSIEWKAVGIGSGVYFCRLSAGNSIKTTKALLLK
jgi:hypothetical protein